MFKLVTRQIPSMQPFLYPPDGTDVEPNPILRGQAVKIVNGFIVAASAAEVPLYITEAGNSVSYPPGREGNVPCHRIFSDMEYETRVTGGGVIGVHQIGVDFQLDATGTGVIATTGGPFHITYTDGLANGIVRGVFAGEPTVIVEVLEIFSNSPLNLATDVAITADIVVTYDQAVTLATGAASHITVVVDAAPLAFTMTQTAADTITIVMDADFVNLKNVAVTIGTAVAYAVGKPYIKLASEATFSFTTIAL